MKVKISADIDVRLVKWIDEKISENVFRNRTHALEFCIKQVKDNGALVKV